MEESITITLKQDDRCFKAGDVLDIPLIKGQVNYMVGPNGSGKSTFAHWLRARTSGLRKYNKSVFDGMTNNDDTLYKDWDGIEVKGLESFDDVYVLDSVDDNPTSFTNSATASGLIMGGGLQAMSLSKGQTSQLIISTFLSKMEKVTGYGMIEHRRRKDEGLPGYDKHPLIILDEIDEGLDLKNQMRFDRLISNIGKVWNATIICICHNPMVALCRSIGNETPVFDMGSRSTKTIGEYISEQAGVEITIRKLD